MVYNKELGKEIPKGWKVGKIREMVEPTIGGDWGKDSEFSNSIKCVSLRGVDLENIKKDGYSIKAPIRFIKNESFEKRKIIEGDIIIGGSGLGPIGRTIFVAKNLLEQEIPLTYSNFCKRLKPKKTFYSIYVEIFLENMYSLGIMKRYFIGTSIPNLDLNSLLEHTIIIPDEKILNVFHNIAIKKFSKLYKKENIILSNIRDSLLSKLMSGEIRV